MDIWTTRKGAFSAALLGSLVIFKFLYLSSAPTYLNHNRFIYDILFTLVLSFSVPYFILFFANQTLQKYWLKFAAVCGIFAVTALVGYIAYSYTKSIDFYFGFYQKIAGLFRYAGEYFTALSLVGIAVQSLVLAGKDKIKKEVLNKARVIYGKLDKHLSFVKSGPKLVVVSFVTLSVVSAWLGGHYGLWPVSDKVHNKYPSELSQDISATADPRLCRGILNPISRYQCELDAPYQLARGLHVDDCFANKNILTRDYCLASTADNEYYQNSNVCNYITEGYYRRFCHFTMQPEELLSLGGIDTWVESGISLLLLFLITYFLCDWFVLRKSRYPKKLASIFFAVMGWVFIWLFSYINPFGLLVYHSVVIQRIACPPNTHACFDGGWISFPTPWGLFSFLVLMPMLYFVCGKFIANLHRRYGSPFRVIQSLYALVSKGIMGQLFIGFMLGTYLAYFGYIGFYQFAEISTPVRAAVAKEPEFIVSTSTWKIYSGPSGFTISYPSNASMTNQNDGIIFDIKPVIGILPDFKDDYGDISTIPDFSIYITQIPLQKNDPIDAISYLKKQVQNLPRSTSTSGFYRSENVPEVWRYCHPTTFGGLEACLADDYAYNQGPLSQFTRHHFYFIHNGYFLEIKYIASLADLSKASYLERRNYKLLLKYTKVVDEVIKSFIAEK